MTTTQPSGRASRPLRVFVVAEVTIYREGLCAFFAAKESCEVVGSATSLSESPSVACDVLVIDCAHVAPSSIDLHRAAADPGAIPVVVLGLPDNLNVALAYLEAGAHAYLTQDASLDELYETVVTVARDGAYLKPRAVRALLARLRDRSGPLVGERLTYNDLTSREREVAQLLSENLSNKEIARRLGISVHTVKNHVHRTLAKLGISRRFEAQEVLARLELRQT